MRSVLHGLRRRLSQPLVIGTFVLVALFASTSLVSAGEVVIGLPATPAPPSDQLDIAAPEDDTPDPPAPSGLDDITDGDGGDPNPPFPSGPDDVTDGDGGEGTPIPPGPDDFTDGDGGEGTPVPSGPDDFVDGDGGEGTPTAPDDFTDGDEAEPTVVPGPDDFTDTDPEPQDPETPADVPANDEASFDPAADPAEPQTFDTAAPVANVAALPVTGAGDDLGPGQSGLAPIFALLAGACLLATGLLHATPGARNRSPRH